VAESRLNDTDYSRCDFHHRYQIYVTAVYFLVSCCTTVGYGDYYGVTDREIIFLLAIQLFCVALFASI